MFDSLGVVEMTVVVSFNADLNKWNAMLHQLCSKGKPLFGTFVDVGIPLR